MRLQVFWKFMSLNGESLSRPIFDSEIIVDVEKRLFRPLTTPFMPVPMFEITYAKLRRNMEQLVLLNSFLIIDQITFGTFLNHLHPPAINFVFFFG